MKTLVDLTREEVSVTVRLRVRRFIRYEGTVLCALIERLPGVNERCRCSKCSRCRTECLDGWFTHFYFAFGGEAGSSLRKILESCSGETLLGHTRSMRLPNHNTPKVLGVEDFAFRSGSAVKPFWWTRNTVGHLTCCWNLARAASLGGFASTGVWG